MAKPKLTETKKITHKLASEGELTIDGNIAVIANPDGVAKNLFELLYMLSGINPEFSFTEEEVEDVIEEDEIEDSDGESFIK